jgi:methionyl-tRNA formyltransferase
MQMMQPRFVLFGDESTLPALDEVFRDDVRLCVTAANRPRALEALRGTPVGEAALVQPPRRSSAFAAFAATLSSFQPDLILCFSYSMLIPQELLDLPRLGAVNIHGGLLPRFRGANVLNWALIEDARETGVTAHFMTAEFDAGDVVFQETLAVSESDTAATLKARLDVAGLAMAHRIREIVRDGGSLTRVPQDPGQARHYRRRTPEDGRIDWKAMDDRQVFNLVRALVAPWPGAFFDTADGQRVVLDRHHTLQEIAALRRQHGR